YKIDLVHDIQAIARNLKPQNIPAYRFDRVGSSPHEPCHFTRGEIGAEKFVDIVHRQGSLFRGKVRCDYVSLSAIGIFDLAGVDSSSAVQECSDYNFQGIVHDLGPCSGYFNENVLGVGSNLPKIIGVDRSEEHTS